MCRLARSILTRQVMVRCAASWFSHPGFTSSWLHITLAPCLKASKSPGTGMPEGRGLYLLKLVSRVLIQTWCLPITYILVRVCTYRNNVKRIMGWVTISHSYHYPLLHWDPDGYSTIQLTGTCLRSWSLQHPAAALHGAFWLVDDSRNMLTSLQHISLVPVSTITSIYKWWRKWGREWVTLPKVTQLIMS